MLFLIVYDTYTDKSLEIPSGVYICLKNHLPTDYLEKIIKTAKSYFPPNCFILILFI